MSKLDSPDLALMETQLLTVSAACTLEAKLNQPFGRRTWPYNTFTECGGAICDSNVMQHKKQQ